MQFTYDAYFAFLERLRVDGYSFRHLDHPASLPAATEPYVILRHDVDVDLGPAVQLAVRESARGVSSDYYVLTTSPFYNPMSSDGRAALATIVAAGHRIGLHFDATVSGADSPETLNAACRRQVEALGDVVGQELIGVSFHRPMPALIGSGPEITAPLPHTYLPFFIDTMEYCTDSTGRWRYGPPDMREAVGRREALHLVTHPIWWGDEDLPPERRLGTFLTRHAASRRDAVANELAVVPES